MTHALLLKDLDRSLGVGLVSSMGVPHRRKPFAGSFGRLVWAFPS
jgi:hypothetical protein